jgi:hypothetical protein
MGFAAEVLLVEFLTACQLVDIVSVFSARPWHRCQLLVLVVLLLDGR